MEAEQTQTGMLPAEWMLKMHCDRKQKVHCYGNSTMKNRLEVKETCKI
jgi:hypothetical protein